MTRKKKSFAPTMYVRRDDDNANLLIVDWPADLANLNASDGDVIAVYVLQTVGVFRTRSRIEER